MSEVLHYISSDGSLREIKYDIHDSFVNLSNLDILHFDVSQLAVNDRMRKLNLEGNKIRRIDITPLVECKKLDTIMLDDETEGETILSDSTIEKIAKEEVYDAITNSDSLSFLPSVDSISYSFPHVRKREPKWKMLHLFQNALFTLGLEWMGILDIGLKKSEQILKKLLLTGFTNEIQKNLLSSLIAQIDQLGTTINLDVESLKQYGELAIRIDDVLDLRSKEMKNQYVPVLHFAIDKESIALLESVGESVDTHYADLRMLLLTAYGYEVLESLAMRTTCEMKVFSTIQNALTSLGFDIKTVPDPNPYSIIGWRNRRELRKHGIKSPEPEIQLPSNISSEMIEYIWQLAEFRNDLSMTIITSISDEPFEIELG
ncbi:MAG: hypothetical protein MUP60_03170 [Candidatus Thorarchaeota archaeon]|nr:hypothetical protein [Candidatus Thorarchaeota archaeon]